MRDVKFRAWDVTDKRMFYNITNLSDINGFLMQYTGLKDKNGCEIYEGDIVESLTKVNNYKCRGSVVFKKGKFVINVNQAPFSANGFEVDFDEEIMEYTIIGNVYESPELVGDSDE